MKESELLQMLDSGENFEIECKKAQGGLPNDVWPTYSAFANTNGGMILLGVQEKDGVFSVVGVDVPKVSKQFWDMINNRQKVSANILRNEDVESVEIQGKQVLKICVPRALREQKPIHVGLDPYKGTY